jgi:hypothetical protein
MTGKAVVPASEPDKRLPQWTYEFAAWLASKPVRPSRQAQIEWIQEFTQRGFNDYRLRKITKQPEFQKALLEYELSHVKRAERLILSKLDKYIKQHEWAVDTAQEDGDYAVTGRLTGDIIGRTVFQKKQEQAQAASVIISISEARITGLDSDVPEIEYEEITDADEED